VLISNCLIRNNSAGSPTDQVPVGGGLYLFRSDVVVRDNSFVNNRAYFGGAIYFDESDPVFINNIIEGNIAVEGAGIHMGGECHPTFTNDRIIHNIADSHGGGLLVNQLSVVMCNGLTVNGNSAQWGAGIGVLGGELRANGCLFSGNHAEIWGGGIAGDFATLNLQHCTFAKDTSDWGSGGLHMDHAVADISHCTFEENKAVFGGGFHAVYSQVTSVQNDFLGNHTETGGAIDYSVDSTIFSRSFRFILRGSNITGNSAFTQCGAVRIEQLKPDFSMVDVEVDSCQFANNHADTYASIRMAGPFEDFILSGSVFSGNSSDRNVGGAAFMAKVKGQVYNCVFNSNYAFYSDSSKTAHCVSMGNESEVLFSNCTFVDTSSADGNCLLMRRGSKADLTNCIFWGCGNHPISMVTAVGLGCTVNINYCNLEYGIDSINLSDTLSVLNWGIGNMTEDPLFASMGTGDLHLQDPSPCIGAGINSFILNEQWVTAPTRDIEGNPGPSPKDSQADMGAYEHPLGFPVITGVDPARIQGESILYQNFPNPFSMSTTISYELMTTCNVDLSIYNILGQRVSTLVSGEQPAGTYNVEWERDALKDGTYFCRLETNRGFVRSRKLILLK
jgi:hypothetical protein